MVFAKLLAVPMSVMVGTGTYTASIDMDYEGAVDIVTGQPVSEDEDNSEQQTITLSDGSVYDRLSHTFNYPISSESGVVKSSVAGGMVTVDEVSLETEDDVSLRVYRNGEALDSKKAYEIEEQGNYSVVVSEEGAEHQLFEFTIIPKKTGALTAYNLPNGFLLNTYSISGEPQLLGDRKSAELKEDGKYEISYRCVATGIDYNLNITVDHTPPKISLDGVKDGAARGAVKLIGVSEDDTVTVIYEDSETKYPKDGEFTAPGKYVVKVTDDAGNEVVEEFEIKMYLNYQGILFGVLTIAVIAAAAVYLYVMRKRLKVR